MIHNRMGNRETPGHKRRLREGRMTLRTRSRGFTLLELMIAVAIGMVVLMSMYTLFTLQNKEFAIQEQIAEMQQSARTAMDMMVREITMAGYDPNRTTTAIAGITAIGEHSLTFTADLNGDGDITDASENLTYAFDHHEHQITRQSGGGTPQPFAENIEGLTFTYYDATGVETSTIASIRRIKISITARTGKADPNYPENGGYRRYTLTSYVMPRNLPLTSGS